MGVEKLIDAPAKRVKSLEKIIEQQERVIHRLRTNGIKFTAARRSKASKGSFFRVIYGDTHGMYIDKKAFAAFLADLKELRPKAVKHLGDGLDCSGFLAEHHVVSVLPQMEYSYEEDCNATNEQLDAVQKIAPIEDYVEGNHEGRVTRQIALICRRHPRDAEMLKRLYGPAAVLSLEKRGIRYIERHKYYDGLRISGTFRLDEFAVGQHGETVTGANAAQKLLSRLGKNVFFGNSHRLHIFYGENLNQGLVAVNTACLCELRPMYGLTKTTDWTHGYVIQFMQPGKGFLAVPIPILDGVSYLSPMLQFLK